MNIDINIDIHMQFGFITPEISISEAMMLLYIVKIDLLTYIELIHDYHLNISIQLLIQIIL